MAALPGARALEPARRRLRDRGRFPQRRVAPVIDLRDDAGDALLETDLLAPAEIAADLADVGEGAVGFARTLRDIDDVAAEKLDQPVDRLRIASPEVPHFAGLVGLGRAQEGLGDIRHVEKVARLRTITDDREWLAGELLLQEYAEHRPVGAGRARARAVGVEDPDRIDRKLVDSVPVERRLLALIFAERIGILRDDRMILAGRRRRQPVAGGGRRIDELGDARRPGAFQHVDGALRVRRHVFHRPLDRGHDVADAGEMEHVVDAVKQLVTGLEVADVRAREHDVGVALVVLEIGLAAAH